MGTIFYFLAVAICAVAVVILLQPDEFRVVRSATIKAPNHVLFAYTNNPYKFNEWNPWAKIDPEAKVTFEGPAEGEGSKMSWDGNNEVGKGSMTNIESRPGELIRFRMDFIKPIESTSTAEFTFEPEGDATRVTWSMYGKNTFMGKAINILVNCDKMVGGQFEKGLSNLKAITENNS